MHRLDMGRLASSRATDEDDSPPHPSSPLIFDSETFASSQSKISRPK